MSVRRERHAPNRRELVISSAVGALAGTAWGMSFVNATGSAIQPEITVLRTESIAILLIESGQVRILVADGQLDRPINELVERATGFLRRRVDVLVASNAVLANLPRGFIDDWRISTLFALPGDNPGFAEPFSNHELAVGDLTLTATPITIGEWSLPQPPPARPWYLEMAWIDTRCIYLSSASVAQIIRTTRQGESTLMITNDPGADIADFPKQSLVAVPAESIDTTKAPGETSHIIRLFREAPQVFRLGDVGIDVRGSSVLG